MSTYDPSPAPVSAADLERDLMDALAEVDEMPRRLLLETAAWVRLHHAFLKEHPDGAGLIGAIKRRALQVNVSVDELRARPPQLAVVPVENPAPVEPSVGMEVVAPDGWRPTPDQEAAWNAATVAMLSRTAGTWDLEWLEAFDRWMAGLPQEDTFELRAAFDERRRELSWG